MAEIEITDADATSIVDFLIEQGVVRVPSPTTPVTEPVVKGLMRALDLDRDGAAKAVAFMIDRRMLRLPSAATDGDGLVMLFHNADKHALDFELGGDRYIVPVGSEVEIPHRLAYCAKNLPLSEGAADAAGAPRVKGIPPAALSRSQRAQLGRFIGANGGEVQAARLLDLSREQLRRCFAGELVYDAIFVLVERRLAALS